MATKVRKIEKNSFRQCVSWQIGGHASTPVICVIQYFSCEFPQKLLPVI